MSIAYLVDKLRTVGAIAAAAVFLGACAYADPNQQYPTGSDYRAKRASGGTGSVYDQSSIFGPGGLTVLGGDEEVPTGQGPGTGIGVNGFLWRASLDTISFMPLASADPFGGVIITDWYSPPETQAERFKITVYILGRDLRADGVRAAVFRQNRDTTGGWIDAKIEQSTTIDLENAILTRARQLRIAGLQ
ncbi:MAG: DUF3576 domain-containing protein [Alphaproteobacteria bacterium]